MSNRQIDYTESTGNIYEDLGFADSEERLAKAKLAMRIEEIIEKRKLTQKQAAKILEINQPKVSAIINGQLSGFSMERLLHFLTLLNQDIEIVIKTKKGRTALTSHGSLKVAFG